MPWGKLFRPLSKKVLKLLAKNLRCAFQNFILRVQGTFLRKSTFWKWWFYCNFSALSEQIWSFEGKFLWRLTNSLPYGFRNRNLGVQGNELRSFFLGKVMVFQSSLYFDQNIFGFWEKTFAKGCQICIRRVQMKALRIFFEKKTLFFCNFCTLSWKFSDFCKTFTAGLPKHQSKCPGNHFSKNV